MNWKSEKDEFKKPVWIEKLPPFPRTVSDKHETEENVDATDSDNYPLHYEEPSWSGIIEDKENYAFEVIKLGKIIENILLKSKSFWVFGRKPNCDIYMLHSTISRYHAVLQYRNQTSDEEKGFYLYDLGSKHGTFLNKNRLKPRVYARVQVGHMIKLGSSTRTFLLTGPEKDTEAESESTVTELKQMRFEELKKREEEAARSEIELESTRKREEEHGVDWGMGDDADEETDLSENPYAQTNNEELYLEDPKKTLRGFMEREGIPFEYDCSEQGMGQFLCKVELPLDDERGRPIFAEVLHKGKKKEAVVQCALEACRILDRHGILRQAKHEPRKRKMKNWEENDYYDSDDDIFLDRTGSVERKREKRMKINNAPQAETHANLLEKEAKISKEITSIEKQLLLVRKHQDSDTNQIENEDSLVSFMKELSDARMDKQKISKLKLDLNVLQKEHETLVKLLNISRPVDLPALKHPKSKTNETKSKQIPFFGKRLKVRVQIPPKTIPRIDADEEEETEREEDEEDSIKSQKETKTPKNDVFQISKEIITKEREMFKNKQNLIEILVGINKNIQTELLTSSRTKELSNLQNQIQDFLSTHKELLKNKNDNRHLHETVDKFQIELEIILSGNVPANRDDQEVKQESKQEESEKRKKKNQRRILQRQEKMVNEKSKGYVEDASKEDYNMWVPPTNQTGDGRTSLNEKLGY